MTTTLPFHLCALEINDKVLYLIQKFDQETQSYRRLHPYCSLWAEVSRSPHSPSSPKTTGSTLIPSLSKGEKWVCLLGLWMKTDSNVDKFLLTKALKPWKSTLWFLNSALNCSPAKEQLKVKEENKWLQICFSLLYWILNCKANLLSLILGYNPSLKKLAWNLARQ